MFKTPLTGFFVKENPRGEKAYVPRIGTPYDNMRNLSTHLDWLVKLVDLLPVLINVPMHLVGTGLILGRINDNICYVPKLIKDPTNACVPTYTVEGLPDGWNFNTTNGVITRSLVDQDLRSHEDIVITVHCEPTTIQHFVNVKILPELTTTAPFITILGSNPLTSVLNTSYTDPGATALDIADGDISSQIQVQGVVDTANNGTYNIIYSVTNSLGVTSTATRIVVVAGDNPPVITLIGGDVITIPVDGGYAPVITLAGDSAIELIVGDAYSEPGASATDVEDGAVAVIPSGTVDPNTIGAYTITYTATDSDNNTVTATRQVTVFPEPVFTFSNGNTGMLTENYTDEDNILTFGSLIQDLGIVAIDKYGNNQLASVVVTGSIPPSSTHQLPVGTHTTYFDITFADGIVMPTLTLERVVVAGSNPVITMADGGFGVGPRISLPIGGTFVEPGVTAFDADDGSLTVSTNESIDSNNAGASYPVIYSATDSHGNLTNATRWVYITPVPSNANLISQDITFGSFTNGPTDTSQGGAVNLTTMIIGEILAGSEYQNRIPPFDTVQIYVDSTETVSIDITGGTEDVGIELFNETLNEWLPTNSPSLPQLYAFSSASLPTGQYSANDDYVKVRFVTKDGDPLLQTPSNLEISITYS